MASSLETDRLILRPWKAEDLPDFARMNADPLVMEYLPRALDEDSSGKLMKRFERHFKKYGYGLYALENKENGAFVGFTGLNHVEFSAAFTPAIEIAWRLDYGHWGRGYATEAAHAVLENGHDTLGLKEIVSFTVHDNTRSIGVMEKIGMIRDSDGDFDYPALRKGHPLGRFVLYRSLKS
ncbi:MAG: GNAT family N-acetyltransferase [Alphaproteobacteria bacterium]